MEHIVNQITLVGTLLDIPQFSHENHGRQFFRFLLSVPRLSGTEDILPVIAQERLLRSVADLTVGGKYRITGQIRSHNSRNDGTRRLLIFVFAGNIQPDTGEPLNEVCLQGLLCREPNYRTTPLGREICDIMLAVPRSFRRADYLPCILWGKTAQEISACHTRNAIQLCGRLQSRRYTKLTEEGPIERTAYEISALSATVSEE